MASKIIQIIPAPPNMWAKCNPTEEVEKIEFSPIVCLALMEDEGNFTWVVPMSASMEGEIDDSTEFSTFGGIVFSENPECTDGDYWE